MKNRFENVTKMYANAERPALDAVDIEIQKGEFVFLVGLSGSGKSTTLYMANSIFGHPRELGSIWKDTFNAKMQRLGVMNNMPNTIDEITNMPPREFSDLAYGISQGRGKALKAFFNSATIIRRQDKVHVAG